jgi:phage terminase large subunit-like protein
LGESFAFIPYFFIPQDTIRQRSERDRVPYAEWARQGHVIPTPGNVVDYEFVKDKIKEVTKTYHLAEIAYDRWGATQISIQLHEDGVLVVPMGQGFASMSGPTKELEKLILGGRVIHGDNPVLRWMISNVVVKQDPAGNLKLDKGKSSDRIDGVVGMVMALDRAVRNEHVSPYSQRGVIAI